MNHHRQSRVVAPDPLAGKTSQHRAPILGIDHPPDETPALESIYQLGDVGPAAVEQLRQPSEGSWAAQPDEVIEQFQLRERDVDGR